MMASGAFSLIQDQNSNLCYNGGKTNGLKALKKGGLSGRKPLGDLSNSVKPTSTQTSKKLNSNMISFTEKEHVFSEVASRASKKKDICNATEKKAVFGGRKALSDISNSGQPRLSETSKKSPEATIKLGTVTEGPIHNGTVFEECFLHNHQECIKAQDNAPDVDGFLRILGLDNGFSHQSSSPWPSPPIITKMKAETPLKSSDSEEMAEHLLIEGGEDTWSPSRLDLTPPCGKSESLDHCFSLSDDDCINFKLMETPQALLKL